MRERLAGAVAVTFSRSLLAFASLACSFAGYAMTGRAVDGTALFNYAKTLRLRKQLQSK